MNFNLKELARIFLHLIFPVTCPVCGAPSEIICPECLKTLINENTINTKIFNDFNNFEIFTGAAYEGNITRAIQSLKYKNNKSIGRPLGKILASVIKQPDEINFLIPVPLHIDSTRNFNQSLEIAKGMAEIWNVKILDAAIWSKIVPRRVGLNATERKLLSDDVFKIILDVKNTNAAIVDDVCTTGTTLLRLKQALENSGAKILKAYTLAG